MENYDHWLADTKETLIARKDDKRIKLFKVYRITMLANTQDYREFDEYPNWIYIQSLSGVDIDFSFTRTFSLPDSFVITDARLIPIPCSDSRVISFRNNNASSAEIVIIISDR